MRIRLAFLALALCCAWPAAAQTQTAVSATVKDPNGIPYSNGTFSIQLIPSGTNPSVNGAAIQGAFNGALDVNGSFSVSLWPNGSITPASTQWQFTVCSNSGGIQPPLGTGTQCTPPTAVTISGSAQVLSTTLSNVAPKLTNFASAGTGTIAGTISAFHIPYANAANTISDIPGSAVSGTGAILLTAQANTTVPLIINGNSGGTQTVPTFESNPLQDTDNCATNTFSMTFGAVWAACLYGGLNGNALYLSGSGPFLDMVDTNTFSTSPSFFQVTQNAGISALVNCGGNFALSDCMGIDFNADGSIQLVPDTHRSNPEIFINATGTQTTPITDFNAGSSTAGLGFFNFRGKGINNWSAGGGHVLAHFMADAPAGQAPVGWMVSNNRSGYRSNGSPSGALIGGCSDVGLCQVVGGGTDVNGDYSALVFESSGGLGNGRGVAVLNSDNNNSILATFTVTNSQSVTHHDTQIWQIGCTPVAGFGCTTVSGVDQNGAIYAPSYRAVDAATNGFGGILTSQLNPCETAYAATTVNTGSATTTTGQTCVPANSMIVDVTYRITTTITTASSFTVGITGSTSKFCSTQSTLTAGTIGHCTLQVNAGTMESGTSAVAVVATFNTTPGGGAIRFEVASIGATPPTS